jgi:hypothetical protein
MFDNNKTTNPDRETQSFGLPQLPGVELVSIAEQVSLDVLQQQYNHQTGQVIVGLMLTNKSAQTIQGPLRLTVNQVSSPIISLAHLSGRTSNGLDYLELTGYLDDFHFRPGQGIFVSPTSNNAA